MYWNLRPLSSIHWPISFKEHKLILFIINHKSLHVSFKCLWLSQIFFNGSLLHFGSHEDEFFKKKKKFSITNVCLQFPFHSDWKVPWMSWPETDSVTHLPAPIFFFLKNYHKKRGTLFDLYAALSTLLNFSSGSAQTHAFQMALKKASLWLLCTRLLAYSRSHYAVTFRKKLRQKAYFRFQLRSSVSIRQHTHDFQVQKNLVHI